MALDPSNGVTCFLCIAAEHIEYLGAIRHWNNLQVGVEGALIWIKDLTGKQVDAVEVKSIPYKELYHASGGQLFLLGSLLPHRNIPSLHWAPVEKGLPVRLPAFNHNYFGIHDKIAARLVFSAQEKEACALVVALENLKTYMETAPAVRLQNLSWALADNEKAIILGTPLLPLQGDPFWCSGDFLLPAGYALELHALAGTLNELINPDRKCWIVWNGKSEYWKLGKGLLRPLSIGSFRVSLKQLYGLV